MAIATIFALLVTTLVTTAAVTEQSARAAKKKSDVVVFAYRLEDETQALSRNKVLTLVEPDGTNLRYVATSGSVNGFDISSTGKKIVYATDDGIWTIGLNGKNDKKLVGKPGLEYMAPSWSPNGRIVWYGTFSPTQGVRLHRHHLTKGELNVAVLDDSNSDARVYKLDVSPNGDYMIIHPSTTFLDQGHRPFIFHIKTGDTDPLPALANAVVWAPGEDETLMYELDGFYSVYDARTKRVGDLGKSTTRFVDSIAVSPDGNTMLEVSSTNSSVTLIDLATGDTSAFPMPSDDMFWLSGLAQWVPTSIKQNPRLCNGWVVTKKSGRKGTTIKGTNGADVISAGGGDDTIKAGGGNDVVCGGQGNDKIIGGRGDDMLFGDAGTDALDGGAGRDMLFGNDGDGDTADGGDDTDYCFDTDNDLSCEFERIF